MEDQLRIIVVGAHPDDEICAGGYALRMARAGHHVRFVSMTNGNSGHHLLLPEELAARRKAETEAVTQLTGIEYHVMPIDDGYLEVNCQNRDLLIAELREFRPHLIITHRPNDYHPDHRNTGVLVQDASYLVMVPNVCRGTQPLERMPVIAYANDRFTQPTPFRADVVVDIDDVLEDKMRMFACHESQVYEWLPWVARTIDSMPSDPEARYAWMKENRVPRMKMVADRNRDMLIAKYGEAGKTITACEACQISEYGTVPDEARMKELFPF